MHPSSRRSSCIPSKRHPPYDHSVWEGIVPAIEKTVPFNIVDAAIKDHKTGSNRAHEQGKEAGKGSGVDSKRAVQRCGVPDIPDDPIHTDLD